jgi:hypothetical protein
MPTLPVPASFALVYAAIFLAVALLNRREFRRSPEKGQRYKALPVVYKLACWCLVIPLFAAGVVFHPAFLLISFVSFATLEGACVRWYRKAGFLPQ